MEHPQVFQNPDSVKVNQQPYQINRFQACACLLVDCQPLPRVIRKVVPLPGSLDFT